MGAEHQPVKYTKEELKNTHPNLQRGWIVREQTRSYLQKSFPIQEKYYNQWRSKVSKAAGYPSSQFSFLPADMGYVPNNQECAQTGYTLVNYPEFPYILSDQIKRRHHETVFFREGQLYYLLYALTAVKIDAKQRGEVVGDIKPENVFISRDQSIKIGILESFPFQSTNYTKFVRATDPSHNVLLAPEDLKIASQKQVENTANPKSEVFSIGATVLSAAILSDLSQIYDYKSRAFLLDKHSAVTAIWLQQNHYSQIFKSIVLNLLKPDPEKRISIEQLWKFLSKYSSSILAKEQFIVVNPPESLQVGVSVIRSKVH